MDDSNIGLIFGDFKVVERTQDKYNRQYIYKSECIICKTPKYATLYELKRNEFRHTIANCKEFFINDEIGKVYDDLEIIKYEGKQSGCYKYTAKCNVCNRIHSVFIKDIRKFKGTRHQYCVRSLPNNKHTKRMRQIWRGMKDRCSNPNAEHYNAYGGRGITCDYEYFIDFYDDMHESYIDHVKAFGEKDTTIERIDVNGNYTKSNIKWDTWENQHKNTRIIHNAQKFIAYNKYDDITYIGRASELSKLIPCDKSSIYDVVNGLISAIKNFTITKI